MAVTRLKLLTCDITNTLIRVRSTPGQHYAEAALTQGVTVNAEALDKVYKTVWKNMRKEHPIYGITEGTTTKAWWTELLARVFLNAGYVNDHNFIQNISDQLFVHFAQGDSWEIYPNSVDVLKRIKERDINLGVISNFDERLPGILEALDLSKYFEFVVTSMETRCEKPDPDMFRVALRKGRVQPHEAGHIGDDVVADYWGAKRLGMAAFLLDRHNKFSGSDLSEIDRSYVLREFSDIEKFL